MPYYQKKVPQIKATRWFKTGDHPDITQCDRETYCRLKCIPFDADIEGEPWAALGVCESKCFRSNEYVVINECLVNPGDYIVEDPSGILNLYLERASIFEEKYVEIIPSTIEEFATVELKAFDSQHFTDDNGCPAGGHAQGMGFTIVWQNGALQEELEQQPGILVSQNGAFVEDVLEACRDRLEYYQQSKFAADYILFAIVALNEALEYLNTITPDRESRGVEGRAIL